MRYRPGLMKPRCRPAYWSAIATRPAQNGAPALVPAPGLTTYWPLESTATSEMPVYASASAATSGTPRPAPSVPGTPACQAGRENCPLKPPPEAQCGPAVGVIGRFHAVS